MRIKKLELCGFKSFKDRTVIQFDAGITGIVGPNGCGKSNIVDALVWVMGEQSAKHLRGASMEDVIFGGAEGYAPGGMAEVSLTLENDGGPFPTKYAKFSEIQLTRRLHRSGESEYLINKEQARLRDIQEIFMDTGAGSKGFSIIEQGAIGKIITAKPEDRRVLIEEAAGITKFKVRKRESQRKLVATDQNLIRLNDIVGELKRQLESLQRQAKRAERYRELKQQIESLDLWITSKKYADLKSSADAAQARFAEAEQLEITGRSQITELDVALQTGQVSLAEKETALQSQRLRAQDLRRSVQEREAEIQELRFEVETAKQKAQIQGSVRSELEARKDITERELADLQEKFQAAAEAAAALEKEYSEKNQEFETINNRIQEIDEELTTLRRELMAVTQSEAALKEKSIGLEARLEDVQQREESQRLVLADLNEKKAPFEDRRHKLYEQLEKERQMQLDLMHDVENFEANLGEVKRQEVEKRHEVETFKDELNKVTSRLYGLENLQANFEGFEEGVKQVMLWSRAQRETHVDGSVHELAPVSEVVEVPAEYEVAMEAALGARLQLVLSQKDEDSLAAVEFLKTQKKGRSSFLSQDADLANHTISQAPQGNGVMALLKDVVKSPEKYNPTVSKLLEGVAIVDGIRTALRLRPEHRGWTFVTPDGDVLDSAGVLTGGAIESADSGVLKRRREIRELTQQKEEWAGKLALAQGVLKKLEATRQTMERDLENAQKEKTAKEILVTELKKDLERAEQELQNLVKAVERQEAEVNQIQAQRMNFEDQLNQLQTHLSEATNRKNTLSEQSESLTLEFENSRLGIDGLRENVQKLRVESASKRQEAEGLNRQMVMMEQSFGDISAQLARMTEESDKNTESLSVNQLRLEEARVTFDRMVNETQEVESVLAQAQNDYEILHAQVREIDEKLMGFRRDQSQLQSTMNEAKLNLEQARLKEEYLSSQIRERYMLELSQIFQEHLSREGDPEAAEAELNDLRDKIKKIGEVNLSAIEEYDDVQKRYDFLSQQQQDLVEAKEQLRRVIDRINRICSKRFKETYEAVNERFKKVFPVLFGGGEASLILIESEEGDEGIDMIARPPGKKLQSVTLLSGGEKALSSVALIFSIFLVKPSPFCLLDEVDAPLDDANVARFNDLVREMARRSQIIIVTHNKYTMEINEKLYGVTMQEKGVSKMVSVSLSEARKTVNAG